MSTTDLPGSSLLAGRYRLVERLGAGGMSVVWRGFDEVLGRQVAVKVLPPSTSADPSFRRRLRAEAQAAARLTHPHITNVYDYGEATTVDGEPVPYVVMELVDGESLAAALARVRLLPWPAAVRICAEVSAALAAAHSRGIVHRDVTPANVMLTSGGAKVVDFGISALIGENDIDPDGSLLGTPAYLAPERLEGGQVSPATDVYAVGLLIYRTLIGQLPWDVGTTTALLRAHQYTEPDPLPHVEGLPAVVATLVGRCLEKRPDDRPSSAELAHVLAGVSAGAPVGPGHVADWAADSGEDTFILPSQHGYTDGRIRPGHADVATSTPTHVGRGVAAVRGVAMGAAAAGAAAAADRLLDAPISPAPGAAIPVSVEDVQAAVAGERVTDVPNPASMPVAAAATSAPPARPVSASAAGAVASPPAPSASIAAPPAPPASAPPGQGGGGGAVHGGPRNNRFAATPRAAAMAAAGAPPAPPAAKPNGPLRHAIGPDEDGAGAPRPGGGGQPPSSNRPAGPGAGRPGKPQSRRVLFGALAVVLLAAVLYAWSLAARPDAKPAVRVLPPEGNCVVSYAVWQDSNKAFQAQVTVANRAETPVPNWNLWFVLNGDQVLSPATTGAKVTLTQTDKGVTLASSEALTMQKVATVQISGHYTNSNAAPLVFKLAGKTCETFVSSKPGAPSQPVQHLSNGSVQLGPVPTTSTPVPGVSIKNGIAQVKPGTSTTPAASGGPSRSTGPSTTPSPSKFIPSSPTGPAPPSGSSASSSASSSAPVSEPPSSEPPSLPPDTADTGGTGTGTGGAPPPIP
jgi:serine/threonine-protein kinase